MDSSRYGAGLQLVTTGRTARLVDEPGVLVATGDTTIDDDAVFGQGREVALTGHALAET